MFSGDASDQLKVNIYLKSSVNSIPSITFILHPSVHPIHTIHSSTYHSFIHSSIHIRFIHLFIYPFIHPHTIHSCIHSSIHPSTYHSFIYSFIHSSIHIPFIHLFIYPFIHPHTIHSCIHSSIHPSTYHSFIYSFIHSFLQEEFRLHFRNISRIMDCVGCDKCRLWGTLQIRGIGTALKILFNGRKTKQLYLSRSEVVSLFNVLGRYKIFKMVP